MIAADVGLRAVEQFTAQIGDLVAQAAAELGQPWPRGGTVYQYTSIATLMAMLAPNRPYVETDGALAPGAFRSIWATAAPYLNDAVEFQHGQSVLASACERARSRLGVAQVEVCSLLQDAIGQTEGLDVFCACFSADGDHLGQWRGYGDNGRGCALGFDLAEMRDGINGLCGWLVYGDETHCAVQNAIADRLVEELISELTRLRPREPAALEDYDSMVVASLCRLLPAVFLLFKDYSFRDEFEYRVVYSDAVAPRLTASGPGPSPRCFRASGAAIVPFVKLDFEGGGMAPLREIRLGPAAQFGVNPKSLEFLLERCGLGHVRVLRSAIPFVPR